MPDYQLFGGVLRSDLVFPELTPARDGNPSWTLSSHNAAVTTAISSALGTEPVDPGVSVALFAVRDSLRLVFDDTGMFEISPDATTIRWYPPASPDLGAVRKDVLGRVIALCLQQRGVVVLHGSAVQMGSVAVAFLAPKYHGKSTTAAALIESGARPLSDDIVAVTLGNPPSVLPGAPVVNLWKDSADQLVRAPSGAAPHPVEQKVQIEWDRAPNSAPVPLAAVYMLSPVRALGTSRIRREQLGGVHAALALLGQSKVGALIGVERRGALLQRLSDLADRVPVYRLEVPRDLARISELTSEIRSWHDPVEPH
jgi:hypothetical protein